MLELLAIAREDGWAFIKKDGQLILLKPPYRDSNLVRVCEDIIEKAVSLHGFEPIHESYPGWGPLVDFLRAELAKVRQSKLGILDDAELKFELLRDAPREILEYYLHRTESELIPNGEWNAALDVLTLLMRVDIVRQDANLCQHAIALLQKCNAGLAANGRNRAELTAEGVVRLFPGVAQKYPVASVMEYMRNVAERHQVMPVGA
ncbi:hypothetical protein SBA4_2350005 [Candidatus Sulfopaludibacter sp. SbA4]|nr:hypothetical protein SBA4_2350005 [Candidatus Sulfopaludibacter sp. SbA4]